MLRESTHKEGVITVFTLCSTSGRPYIPGKAGIRTTGWPTSVTCAACKKEPALAKHPEVS